MEPIEILKVTCVDSDGKSMYNIQAPAGMSSEEMFFVCAAVIKSLVKQGFVKDIETALEKLIYYTATPDGTEVKPKKTRKTKAKKE